MIINVDRYRLECLRCGHKWWPKQPDIRQCPKCRSGLWDVPKDGSSMADKPQAQQKPKAQPKPQAKTIPEKPEDVSEDVWNDFKYFRKEIRAPITHIVVNGFRREAAKAGVSLEEAITTCLVMGWRGFKADWVKDKAQGRQSKLLWNGIDKQDFGERRKI